MNETLKWLCERFRKKPELLALNASVEANHRLLIERLDKPERKLVRRSIDDETAITGALSLDVFLCGFRLAWWLSNELNNFDDEWSVHFLSDEGGDNQ